MRPSPPLLSSHSCPFFILCQTTAPSFVEFCLVPLFLQLVCLIVVSFLLPIITKQSTIILPFLLKQQKKQKRMTLVANGKNMENLVLSFEENLLYWYSYGTLQYGTYSSFTVILYDEQQKKHIHFQNSKQCFLHQ